MRKGPALNVYRVLEATVTYSTLICTFYYYYYLRWDGAPEWLIRPWMQPLASLLL